MLPTLHEKLCKPDVNSLFRDNCSYILARRSNLSHCHVVSHMLRNLQGCPRPGVGCKEHSGRLRYSCSPQIWLCSSPGWRQEKDCFGLLQTRRLAAKEQQGHTVSTLWRSFLLIIPAMPQGTLLLPELCTLLLFFFFSLLCVASVQMKTPRRTHIYNLLFLKRANECAMYQRGPKGTDTLTSLRTV